MKDTFFQKLVVGKTVRDQAAQLERYVSETVQAKDVADVMIAVPTLKIPCVVPMEKPISMNAN